MIGIILVIIGGILLLQSLGLLGATFSGGMIWGIVLIVIGIMMIVRRASRRGRREQWVAERNRRWGDRQGKGQGTDTSAKNDTSTPQN